MIPATNAQLEQYSKEIFSEAEASRQHARAMLIQHTASFQNPVILSDREKKLFPNWHRVSSQMNEMINRDNFPYSIDTKKAGKIIKAVDIPIIPLISHADFVNSNEPCYIVTMAHTPKLTLEQPVEYLAQQINLLWNEGFGANAAASRAEAHNRLAIVVGINYCHSLDRQANRRNRAYIAEAAGQVTNTHIKVCAFSWSPIWIGESGAVSERRVKRLFRLLSDANPGKAEQIFAKVMQDKVDVIPYQLIRNEIKNNGITASFYRQLKHGYPNRPNFLVSWDDDAVRLRTEDNLGLFSHYDLLIAQYPQLEVASTGYYMTNAGVDFIEFASRADLVARQAIAHTLPNGAYLPEPNLIIRISSLEALKNRISFLREGSDKGKGLEFLGLMKKLDLMKGDVRGRVVFGKIGPIVTSQPARAKAPAHMPKVLTPARINNAENLASLRMFCQSVLNPKKGFAVSVARAMPVGTGDPANTALISKLYTAFDPIDYIKILPDWKLLYDDIVSTLINIYNAKFEYEHNDKILFPNFNVRAQRIIDANHLDQTKKEAIASLLKIKFQDIWNARRLITNGPLSETQFRSLFIAALNATEAVYTFLYCKIEEIDFEFPHLFNDD